MKAGSGGYWKGFSGLKRLLPKCGPVLHNISAAGGDLFYILHVLSIIRDEEDAYERREKGRDIPVPPAGRQDMIERLCRVWPHQQQFVEHVWTDGSRAVSVIDEFYEIKKEGREGLVDIDIEDAPGFLLEKIREMEGHRLHMMTNPIDAEGTLTATYTLETACEGERYILECVYRVYLLKKDTVEVKKTSVRKGPRGSPRSNAAIYLLYRYLRGLLGPGRSKRQIEITIAGLVNSYSNKFFRPGDKMAEELNWDKVRKRIDWVEKGETERAREVREFALKWEEKWGEIRGNGPSMAHQDQGT